MTEKTCCVTGHRDLSEDEMELLRPRLATEVEQAVAAGFNCFLSGFAEGADLLFAEIVARMKRTTQSFGWKPRSPTGSGMHG